MCYCSCLIFLDFLHRYWLTVCCCLYWWLTLMKFKEYSNYSAWKAFDHMSLKWMCWGSAVWQRFVLLDHVAKIHSILGLQHNMHMTAIDSCLLFIHFRHCTWPYTVYLFILDFWDYTLSCNMWSRVKPLICRAFQWCSFGTVTYYVMQMKHCISQQCHHYHPTTQSVHITQ